MASTALKPAPVNEEALKVSKRRNKAWIHPDATNSSRVYDFTIGEKLPTITSAVKEFGKAAEISRTFASKQPGMASIAFDYLDAVEELGRRAQTLDSTKTAKSSMGMRRA